MNKEENGAVTVSADGVTLPARRHYKDTIFCRLFQDRENLLSLYEHQSTWNLTCRFEIYFTYPERIRVW